jgi:hypothetical protein
MPNIVFFKPPPSAGLGAVTGLPQLLQNVVLPASGAPQCSQALGWA